MGKRFAGERRFALCRGVQVRIVCHAWFDGGGGGAVPCGDAGVPECPEGAPGKASVAVVQFEKAVKPVPVVGYGFGEGV